MPPITRQFLATLFLLTCVFAVSLRGAKGPGSKGFARAWEGQRVAVTRTLYSVTFDERGRLLPIKRNGRVEGINVATPGEHFYRFASKREAESDIVDRDPERVVATLRTQYRRSTHLEIGNVQDIEDVLLVRYDPGVELVVKKVQFERNRVRLMLHKESGSDLATTLTIDWPADLSKDISEAPALDRIIGRFLKRSPAE